MRRWGWVIAAGVVVEGCLRRWSRTAASSRRDVTMCAWAEREEAETSGADRRGTMVERVRLAV